MLKASKTCCCVGECNGCDARWLLLVVCVQDLVLTLIIALLGYAFLLASNGIKMSSKR